MNKLNNFYYDIRTKQPYHNRIQAIKEYPYCRFYFHEKEFSKVDWTNEPSLSLTELYNQRAQQIRDKYDYVILCYSGGADSTNILETFVNNKIPIDQILTVGAISQDQHFGDDTNHNGDVYHNAFPLFKELNIKPTIVDYTTYFDKIENFSIIRDYQSDWVNHIGPYMSPHNWFWRDIKTFIGKNNDKKTGVIFGHDKPYVFLDEQNKYYTVMYDTSFTSYGNFQQDQNFEKVNFYTSLDSIDLMKKQVNLVKRFLITVGLSLGKHYEEIINELIYDLKHPLSHISRKSPQKILSLRDTFLLDKTNSDLYRIYTDGIKKAVSESINKPIETRRYYI